MDKKHLPFWMTCAVLYVSFASVVFAGEAQKAKEETIASSSEDKHAAILATGVDFTPKPLVQTEVSPVKVEPLEALEGGWLIDFGKAAFGTVRFQATATEPGQVVTVHLGETIDQDGARINRKPGGTIRYRAMQQPLKEGTHWYRVRITPDQRNTMTVRGAIAMPDTVGEVMPFRYCELEGYPGTVKPESILQVRVHYPFDEDASQFESSNQILNDIWELCKYSMKATSFTGVYIDGDRERIPYEGDAYINQLWHYCADTEYAVARRTMEYFWDHPTWPVEWHQHMPLMAWAEYLYTGDRSFLEKHYDQLVAKLLLPLAGPDGLLKAPVKKGVGAKTLDKAFLESIGMKNNRSFRILVDWPTTERDGHVLKQVNSVVNAFHYNNLLLMSRIALDLGKDEDARRFADEATRVAKAYQKAFFKEAEGIYRDGVGTDHSSIHANLFPLAFGLVPAEHQQSVADFVVSRGMGCSVYAAQYLMEALYRSGRANEAFDLLVSQDIRSWYNMIRVGSTITLEAWDNKFKPNQDWNHAWGGVPANIIPRYLLGVRPLEPGFGRVLVRPMPGRLQQAEATVPTPRGGIDLKINNEAGSPFELTLSIPANMTARVEIPLPAGQGELLMNGKKVKCIKRNGFAVMDGVVSGTHHFRTTAEVTSMEQGDGEQGVAPTAGTTTTQEFSSEQVLKTLELANSYFSKKYPDVEVIQGGHELKHKEFPSCYWGGAVYYTGLMALYSVDPKEEYYQQAVAFGEANQWKLNSYRVGKLNSYSHNANDHCAGETYVDLYQIDPKPERIATIRNCINRLMETPVEPTKNAYPNWFWVDALYMAMPTFAKLGVLEQDEAYFDHMHALYLSAKNEIGGGLYNAEDGLWWRDADFVTPYKEPNGEDCYWSRGNGWVYAALSKVLSVLPEDNKYRPEYLKVFKEMSAALLKAQRSDGFWNVSLHDPSNFGGKELTGTSMFVYGFAWGVNNGVLEEKIYAPAMLKAWRGMAECVHPNGFLGYVQGSGKEPKSSQPVHYDRVPDLEDYGLGCFLLAGSELFKWKSGKSTTKIQDQKL